MRLRGEGVTLTPFVQQLATEYGDKGELAVHAYLLGLYPEPMYQVTHWPTGETGVDFLVTTSGSGANPLPVFWADSEVRTEWREGLFRFDTIHVPFRKRGMIEALKPFYYFGVRSDYRLAYIIPGTAILKSPVILVKNRVHPTGDDMFDVARDYARNYVDLVSGEMLYDER